MSLSSDGHTVAIGGRFNDGNAGNAGHVRVYGWDVSDWSQMGSDIDGEATSDNSGWSVDLSSDGSRLAIGAYLNDGAGSEAGHVRVYEWNGTAWSQLGADIDGEGAGDRSGYSVAMSSDGSRVAIGAYLNDGNGTSAGHVRVYEWNGSAWRKLGSDIDGGLANDRAGVSTALSSDGSVVAIGADQESQSKPGYVSVYALSLIHI